MAGTGVISSRALFLIWLGLDSLQHPQVDYGLQSAAGVLHLEL